MSITIPIFTTQKAPLAAEQVFIINSLYCGYKRTEGKNICKNQL